MAEDSRKLFSEPPAEFTQMPWWFWNDDITEEGIARQLADFREKGLHGFTIHARMGLPRSIPYMGERWLQLVRFAVEEAKRTGMIVHLYDEGMYPSGSAHGEVVKGHPELAARGIEMRDIPLPTNGPMGLLPEEKLVAVVAAGRSSEKGGLDGKSLKLIDPDELGNMQLSGKRDVDLLMAFVLTPSGGVIRGVQEGEEDSDPGAPPAADLLNPKATERFIELTHETYFRTIGEHFGKTVLAIFTDEPSIMGRAAKKGLFPWTEGFEDYFRGFKGYDIRIFLPGLWHDIGPKTEKIRKDYKESIASRLNDAYYRLLFEWCEEHEIALTGHPAGSDDIGPLRYFQIPGQDIVWREAEPEKDTSLEGPSSTVGKCSSSAARHYARRRNGNELYGAYGWELTCDEMKWMADWLMVRGVNLFWPHAFYYSVRGNRGMERPPDVGPNNLWWPHYRKMADYTHRLHWLLSDCHHVCDVAVLCSHDWLPWKSTRVLFENQYDFNYLEDRLLLDLPSMHDDKLRIADQSYAVLIVEVDERISKPVWEKIEAFAQRGVRVFRFDPGSKQSRRELLNWLDSNLAPDLRIDPSNDDLRYIHVIKDDWHFYYMTNEGGNSIDGKLSVRSLGSAEWWDPLTGETFEAVITGKGENSMSVPLTLQRREGKVLAINPEGKPSLTPHPSPPKVVSEIAVDHWELLGPSGEILSERLVDWGQIPGYGRYSGTLAYRSEFNLDSRDLGDRATWWVSLGEVHDSAEIKLNNKHIDVRLWGPFIYNIASSVKEDGNHLVVEVTNSMANRLLDARKPSGLMGPVKIIKFH